MLLTAMLLHDLLSLFSDGTVYSGLGPPTLRTNQEDASTDISTDKYGKASSTTGAPFSKMALVLIRVRKSNQYEDLKFYNHI